MLEKTCLVCSSGIDSENDKNQSIDFQDDTNVAKETLLHTVLQLSTPKEKTKSTNPENLANLVIICRSCVLQVQNLQEILEKLKSIEFEFKSLKGKLLDSVILSVVKSCTLNRSERNNKETTKCHSLKEVASKFPKTSIEYHIYRKWRGRCQKEFSNATSSLTSSVAGDSKPSEIPSASHTDDHCYSTILQADGSNSNGNRNSEGIKPAYFCSQCDSTFNRKAKLREHVSSCHEEEKYAKKTNLKTYSKACTTCKETFLSKQTYQTHIQAKDCSPNPGPKSPVKRAEKHIYNCVYCPKTFTNKQGLFHHVASHTGEKAYKCSTCSKSFANQTQLSIHIRTHTGERPYVCQLCGLTWSSLPGLSSHFKTHAGTKPFKCNTCEKSFRSSGHLAKHQLIHSGERPFSCSRCHRSFNRKENLRSHEYTHEKLKPHACSLCPQIVTFSRAGLLRKHMQDRHLDPPVVENPVISILPSTNFNKPGSNFFEPQPQEQQTIVCLEDANSSKEIVSIICNLPNSQPTLELGTSSATTTTTDDVNKIITNEPETLLEETLFFTSTSGGQYIILKEVTE